MLDKKPRNLLSKLFYANMYAYKQGLVNFNCRWKTKMTNLVRTRFIPDVHFSHRFVILLLFRKGKSLTVCLRVI